MVKIRWMFQGAVGGFIVGEIVGWLTIGPHGGGILLGFPGAWAGGGAYPLFKWWRSKRRALVAPPDPPPGS